MAETTIRVATEVADAAVDLIDEHHEHLQTARILWLFTSAKRTRGNRVTLGSANRSTVLTKFLSQRKDGQPADYIVQIDEKRWQTMLATQRSAFVDSMLCRMQQREVVNQRSGKVTQSWITVEPDVQEFTDVIMRHGVWLPQHQRFAKAIQQHGGKQLTLKLKDLQEEPDDEPEVRSSGSEPEHRVTTVDQSGGVVSTELEGNAESHDATGSEACACGGEHTTDDHDMVTAMLQRQAARNGTDAAAAPLLEVAEATATGTVGSAHGTASAAPSDWRAATGVDTGELAEHRRRRRTAVGARGAVHPDPA